MKLTRSQTAAFGVGAVGKDGDAPGRERPGRRQ